MDEIARRDEADLYETDFYAWSQRQAALLGGGDFGALDLINLVEEIESLGRAQVNALQSRYAVLCLHLLKLIIQPKRATRSWQGTIVEQRNRIARLFKENPSLRSKRQLLFAEGYEDGRRVCAAQTGVALDTIPKHPPFTVEEAEDETWLPAFPDYRS